MRTIGKDFVSQSPSKRFYLLVRAPIFWLIILTFVTGAVSSSVIYEYYRAEKLARTEAETARNALAELLYSAMNSNKEVSDRILEIKIPVGDLPDSETKKKIFSRITKAQGASNTLYLQLVHVQQVWNQLGYSLQKFRPVTYNEVPFSLVTPAAAQPAATTAPLSNNNTDLRLIMTEIVFGVLILVFFGALAAIVWSPREQLVNLSLDAVKTLFGVFVGIVMSFFGLPAP